jgi:hypothetical protein
LAELGLVGLGRHASCSGKMFMMAEKVSEQLGETVTIDGKWRQISSFNILGM